MQLELTGKRVLVAGASRGLGRAIAETFVSEGCHVAINSRHRDELERTAAALGERVSPIVADVSKPEEAARLVAEATRQLGGLDILITNVGGGRSVPPGGETAEEWQRVFAQNLWSATNMVEAAREPLSERRGAVVCISSICGCETVPGAPVTYSAAKAALNAYVRGIARPLGREGIRINAVAPGNLVFDGSVWRRKLEEDEAAVNAMLERDVALRVLGHPADIAGLVVWLASSRARFATGAVYVIDGGQVRGG